MESLQKRLFAKLKAHKKEVHDNKKAKLSGW